MKFTIIVTEDRKGNFFAAAPGLPDCHVQAATRHDAIRQMRMAIRDIIDRSEILQVDVPVGPQTENVMQQTPWDVFGVYRNDPAWGEFFDHIEQERELEQNG